MKVGHPTRLKVAHSIGSISTVACLFLDPARIEAAGKHLTQIAAARHPTYRLQQRPAGRLAQAIVAASASPQPIGSTTARTSRRVQAVTRPDAELTHTGPRPSVTTTHCATRSLSDRIARQTFVVALQRPVPVNASSSRFGFTT